MKLFPSQLMKIPSLLDDVLALQCFHNARLLARLQHTVTQLTLIASSPREHAALARDRNHVILAHSKLKQVRINEFHFKRLNVHVQLVKVLTSRIFTSESS